jgi:hypothetical protein
MDLRKVSPPFSPFRQRLFLWRASQKFDVCLGGNFMAIRILGEVGDRFANGFRLQRCWWPPRSCPYKLLQLALVAFGAVMLLLYPLAVVWPSGWTWHSGPPYQSDYFMMIVGIHATLGVFLITAARSPERNLSLIWFTIWSSVVHAAIMAGQSFRGHHMGHLWGDVSALLLVAVVLAVLVVVSHLGQTSAGRARP